MPEHPRCALGILLAHHCILRTCELIGLLARDFHSDDAGLSLTLRETKIGQRMGVNEEVSIKDAWLCEAVTKRLQDLPPGAWWCELTPCQFAV